MLNRLEDGTWLIDHSTIDGYQRCRKLFELSYLRNLKPNVPPAAFDFGGAFHAGVAAYRLGKSTPEIVEAIRDRAKHLPFAADESKRSVENCVNLVGRWIDHWSDPRRNVYRVAQHQGQPLVEVSARAVLCTTPRQIVYVGKMDAVLEHIADGTIWDDELKTTSRLDSRYMESVRPNNQGTGYTWLLSQLLGRRAAGWILDAALVAEMTANSRRKPEDWFARNHSRRSDSEIEDWLQDTTLIANEIIDRVEAWLAKPESVRFVKQTHSCHAYDGCMYRPVCRTNEDPGIIASDFHHEQWDLLAMDNAERTAQR